MYASRLMVRAVRPTIHFAIPLRRRTCSPSSLRLGARLLSYSSSRLSLPPSPPDRLPPSPSNDDALRHAKPLVPNNVAARLTRAGTDRNSRLFVMAVVLSAIGFYLYNSQTVPVTGRRRFNFLSDSVVALSHARMAEGIINQVHAQGGHLLGDRDPRTILVRRVMRRLIPVSGMTDQQWEIFVIADNSTVNAFVIPGGKVFVFSGLINACRNEDALAAVLGHEVAHNTASHLAERMSVGWVGSLTMGSLFFLAGALPGLALFGIWNFVGGYYLQDLLFDLPMGRQQEVEADFIGLMMMAEACYDPMQAVKFWERMEVLQKAGGQDMPEVLSTHPSSQNRMSRIMEWMPQALEKRRLSDCRGTAAFADRFRDAMRKRVRVVEV